MLLVCAYVVQPAVAFAALGCLDHACGTEVQCCCEEPAPEPVQPVSKPGADDCCSATVDEEPLPASPTDDEDCGCHADPAPLPDVDPALPVKRGQGALDESPAEWVRQHGTFLASLVRELPWDSWSPGLVPGRAQGARVSGMASSPARDATRGGASSAAGWELVARGVHGLLAVFCVARL